MRMAAPLQATPRGNPQQILATVWQRNLPLVRQRVRSLREAADTLQSGPLTAECRTEATEIAHKLAGSLGMFGFPQGSEVSRNLELLLESEAPLSPGVFRELTAQLEQVLSF